MSTPGRRLVDTANSLLRSGGLGTESTAGGAPVNQARLRTAIEKLLASAEPAPVPQPPVASLAADTVLRSATEGLEYVAGGGSPSNLTDLQIASLEAIVHVTGRPAMNYRNGQVENPPSDLGENDRWRVLIVTERSEINQVSASVGRVGFVRPGATDEPIGTAWRLKTDLVVTNRHVAQRLASDPAAQPSTWQLSAGKPSIIDFGATAESAGGPRFTVVAIAFCSDEADVDLAVLRLDPAGKTLPPALPLDLSASSLGREVAGAAGPTFQGKAIYIVGHPFRDVPSAASVAVFGSANGLKRWQPGLVTSVSNAKPLLEHDCSTLGGNSGSCVFAADGHAVVGVHVGGRGVNTFTGQGDSNLAIALTRLQSHPASASFLV